MCVSLAARSELFRRTWLRDRSDLRDTSASAFDLNLATIGCLAGWHDQQVANLLVASRRTHDGHAGKALRRDYVVRTLARAQEAAAGMPGLSRRRVADLLAVARRRALVTRVKLPGRGAPQGYVREPRR